MSVKELDASTFSILTGKARGAPRISLHWDSVRIEVLRAKASAQHLAEFECAGARGQLAAAAGDFDEAERVLLSILHEFKRLYPDNPHFFTHIVQLALAMQALDLVGRFLNDRYGTPDMFLVTFGQATSDPAINLVTVDDTGRCHFTVDPRIPGTGQADYFVGHWLSSAPLWGLLLSRPGLGGRADPDELGRSWRRSGSSLLWKQARAHPGAGRLLPQLGRL